MSYFLKKKDHLKIEEIIFTISPLVYNNESKRNQITKTFFYMLTLIYFKKNIFYRKCIDAYLVRENSLALRMCRALRISLNGLSSGQC